tara:strand:+ start:46 stop:288 length:243 start_codon:yes stop_codon:yes gene_type:complete
MNNKEFEDAIEKSQKHMKRAIETLYGCSNEQGQFPKINASPVMTQYNALIVALRQSRQSPILTGATNVKSPSASPIILTR